MHADRSLTRALWATCEALGRTAPDRRAPVVDGLANGFPVRVNLAGGWTRIDVGVPATPLFLEVRPPLPDDDAHTEAGRLVEVPVGDDLFHRAFVVEAAPSDVTRALLSEGHLRSWLLRFYPLTLRIYGRHVSLLRPGLATAPSQMAEAIDLAATVAARLPGALHEADQGDGGPDTPYRRHVCTTADEGLLRRRALETDALLARHYARAQEDEDDPAARRYRRWSAAAVGVLSMLMALAIFFKG